MTKQQQPQWQPIKQLPLIAHMIDEGLALANEQYEVLQQARAKPHVLDDYTIQREIKVFTDQKKDLWMFDEQLRRWQAEPLATKERREVERLQRQMQKLHKVNTTLLDLAEQLKEQTIEKIIAMDDAELALKTLADPHFPGIDELQKGAAKGLEKLFTTARQVEPELARRFTAQPAKNPLEALLRMVDEIMGVLQGKELPVPDEVRTELARLLAWNFDFSATWPYTREQMQATMTPGQAGSLSMSETLYPPASSTTAADSRKAGTDPTVYYFFLFPMKLAVHDRPDGAMLSHMRFYATFPILPRQYEGFEKSIGPLEANQRLYGEILAAMVMQTMQRDAYELLERLLADHPTYPDAEVRVHINGKITRSGEACWIREEIQVGEMLRHIP